MATASCCCLLLSSPRLLLRPPPPRGLSASRLSTYNPLCRALLYGGAGTVRKGGCCAAVASMIGRKATKRDIVVPDPDYRIPVVLLGLAGTLAYQENLLAAAPVCLLGLLLLFQTTRVRFVFDDEALEVKYGDQLQESGENIFVGGKNRWK